MRRVLVPLDGRELSASIIPDARRIAGPDGELILVQDVLHAAHDPELGVRSEPHAMDQAQEYLNAVARTLRAEGVRVRAETLVIFDVARSIDDAATIFKVDMIACATHARSGFGRLVRGSIAWQAVAHSPVPVLLRHPEDGVETPAEVGPRRILVPLDGSEYSKKALPLAAELAKEWSAPLYLTQVIPDLEPYHSVYRPYDALPYDLHRQMRDAQAHLDTLATLLPGEPHTHIASGNIVENLVEDVQDWGITDVVMASHGRAGLSRIVIGSVADALVHRLHCPIIIVPALASTQAGAVLADAGAAQVERAGTDSSR